MNVETVTSAIEIEKDRPIVVRYTAHLHLDMYLDMCLDMRSDTKAHGTQDHVAARRKNIFISIYLYP